MLVGKLQKQISFYYDMDIIETQYLQTQWPMPNGGATMKTNSKIGVVIKWMPE